MSSVHRLIISVWPRTQASVLIRLLMGLTSTTLGFEQLNVYGVLNGKPSFCLQAESGFSFAKCRQSSQFQHPTPFECF